VVARSWSSMAPLPSASAPQTGSSLVPSWVTRAVRSAAVNRVSQLPSPAMGGVGDWVAVAVGVRVIVSVGGWVNVGVSVGGASVKVAEADGVGAGEGVRVGEGDRVIVGVTVAAPPTAMKN